MTEEINCQYCGHDRHITEDTTCRCGAELFLSQSLREQIKSFEAQITAFRLMQGKAVSELCRRERLRNIRQGKGQTSTNFWQSVIGKPAWADAGQKRQPKEIVINMADFD